jgi:hypothetical protein
MCPSTGDTSAEGECKRFDTGIEELDRERPIHHWLRLPDQLIEPLFVHRSVAALINVKTMCWTRRLSVNGDAETHGHLSRVRSQNEVQITRVKSVRDPPSGNIQDSGFCLDRPFSG